MRIRLKGLNSKKRTLADGSVVTYYWAWKGGPRLPGRPGDPQFMAAYNAAVGRKVQTPSGTIQSILNGFQASGEWGSLAPRTQSDYIGLIKIIEKKFGTFPLSALGDRQTIGVFKAWRSERAHRSRRQADYGWQVLARILSWAHGDGLTIANPCKDGGRLYRGTRKDHVWSDADEAAFLAHAPAHLHLALTLALWTGQRQGDLLALTWMQYDGAAIRLKQGKTGAYVYIPVGAPLKAALDAMRGRSGPILLNSDGAPWTPDGFRSSWRKACAACGVIGVTFNDLRGTAVTRLGKVGCTVPEIATITGHSLRDVGAILDAHYLERDPAMAESAIRKLETGTKIPD